MHTQKILLLNLGYETGLSGSMREYITQSWHYLHTPNQVLQSIHKGFQMLIERTQPDVCCLLEVHHDPAIMRTLQAYHCKHIDPKYGRRSILRRLPLFRDNCNAVFTVDRLPCRERELVHGTKKLLYDVTIAPECSLFVGHFSLNAAVRKQQFDEIAELVEERTSAIVCGDFNDYGGIGELKPLLRTTGMKIVRPTTLNTFPACHPRRALDLFLCTPNITHVSAEVLTDVHLSDHLPVMLTVKI